MTRNRTFVQPHYLAFKDGNWDFRFNARPQRVFPDRSSIQITPAVPAARKKCGHDGPRNSFTNSGESTVHRDFWVGWPESGWIRRPFPLSRNALKEDCCRTRPRNNSASSGQLLRESLPQCGKHLFTRGFDRTRPKTRYTGLRHGFGIAAGLANLRTTAVYTTAGCGP